MIVVSPGTCRQTSPVGFETEGKQEEGANILSKIFVPHLLSSLRKCQFQSSCLRKQMCLERGAVYGARTASGLVIFRWIEINFNFNKIKTAPKFKRCERLGVEEVAGSLMEVLEGQVRNTIQLEVCLW